MKRLAWAVLVCVALIQPGHADEIVFDKRSLSQSWGSYFRNAFGFSDFGRSYALVVRVSRFGAFTDLRTQADSDKMAHYLINEAGFDYVHVLTDDSATVERVSQLMDDFSRARSGATTVLSFTGPVMVSRAPRPAAVGAAICR